MTDFQKRCCAAIASAPNKSISTHALAAAVKSSMVGVVSAMRSLERAGIAKSFRHGNDQWAPLYWHMKRKPTDRRSAIKGDSNG